MAIFGAGNINAATLSQKTVNLCAQLVNVLQSVQDLYAWASGQTTEDLEALGLSAGDLQFIQSAMADANAVAEILFTGLPPGTYPQPASAYVYATSMRQIMGP